MLIAETRFDRAGFIAQTAGPATSISFLDHFRPFQTIFSRGSQLYATPHAPCDGLCTKGPCSLDAHRHLQSDVIPDSPGCRAHDAAGRDRAAHGAALQHRRPAPLHPARLEITDFYFLGDLSAINTTTPVSQGDPATIPLQGRGHALRRSTTPPHTRLI